MKATKKQKQKQKKSIYPTFIQNGMIHMRCKSCKKYEAVSDKLVSAVTCGVCNAIKAPWPKSMESENSSGRPAGWHFMKEFVDKDGNVFHKGVEQPKLKGTLKPTKVNPKPKRKNKSKKIDADTEMFKQAREYKKKQEEKLKAKK